MNVDMNSKAKLPSSNDTIKKLIYSATILVKQLDAIVSKAKTCRDLFTPESIELRSQLAHLCGKSIRADPLQCRRKAEDILWKKCYYNVVAAAKINGTKSSLTPMDKFYLENHIDSGIAKLTEYLHDVWQKLCKVHPAIHKLNIFPTQSFKTTDNEVKESKEDLIESVQRVLVWLGDLSRYRNDLGITISIITAKRLYYQAVIVNPSTGLPLNQLGTLTSHDSDAAYESIFYYIRSMHAAKSFPGAGPNLKGLLVKLAGNEDKMLSSFSQLFLKLLFGHKEEAFEVAQICQTSLGEIQTQLYNNEISSYLLDVAGSVMMCAVSSDNSTAAIAFCCSLFSHILSKLQVCFGLVEKDVPVEDKQQSADEISEDEEEETKRAKLRRRKVGSGSSDQEFSDEEIFLDADSEDDSEEEVLSDSGFHSAEAKNEIEIPQDAILLLPVFKLFTDWFQANVQIVQVSNPSVRKMWSTLADILNVFKRCQREAIEQYQNVPLEEDWKFFGVTWMTKLHSQMNFEESYPTTSIATSLRINRITSFGTWLAGQNESGFNYADGMFSCQLEDQPTDTTGNKDDLMRNMAQLWLKSEVQDLERKLSPQPKRKKKSNIDLSNLPFVFLVPDVSALSEYAHLIKQIIKNQKMIVVIPNIVISEMDQLKRESPLVRDCIRWLETSFRNGNRFVRAQRQNEHQVIPLLTYPKRKDKASWTLFQILECCYYLDNNHRTAYKTSQNLPIVMHLTGSAAQAADQQTKGICTSIGVEIRSVDSLIKKSKTKKF